MQVTRATITPLEDGSFVVECEHEANPAGPAALEMPEEPGQLEIYDTLDEAIEYLRSKLDGEMGRPMMEGEEDFLAGFKGANGDQGY
jgi:hypothetical protein